MSGNSLAEAFMANRGRLLRYLRARGAGDEADDLLQELWLKLDGGGSGEAVVVDASAYLHRMAHNLLLDRWRGSLRRQRREATYHGDAASGGEAPDAERTLIARETLRRIDGVLAALGPRTDAIFRRYRVEGTSQREIAADLGITLSAVEKHLQKAYRAVADAQQASRDEDAR